MLTATKKPLCDDRTKAKVELKSLANDLSDLQTKYFFKDGCSFSMDEDSPLFDLIYKAQMEALNLTDKL